VIFRQAQHLLGGFLSLVRAKDSVGWLATSPALSLVQILHHRSLSFLICKMGV
jgi:hypothetical protein